MDCPVENCAEIRDIKNGFSQRFITKKSVWVAFTSVGIILLIIILKTWAGQEYAPALFVSKTDFAACEQRISDRIAENEKRAEADHVIQGHLINAIQEIKTAREETRKERKEQLSEQRQAFKDIFDALHKIEMKLPKDVR